MRRLFKGRAKLSFFKHMWLTSSRKLVHNILVLTVLISFIREIRSNMNRHKYRLIIEPLKLLPNEVYSTSAYSNTN